MSTRTVSLSDRPTVSTGFLSTPELKSWLRQARTAIQPLSQLVPSPKRSIGQSPALRISLFQPVAESGFPVLGLLVFALDNPPVTAELAEQINITLDMLKRQWYKSQYESPRRRRASKSH
jgi:hypothetical protein